MAWFHQLHQWVLHRWCKTYFILVLATALQKMEQNPFQQMPLLIGEKRPARLARKPVLTMS